MQSLLMAGAAALMYASAVKWGLDGNYASVLVFVGFGTGYAGLAILFQ